MLQVGLVKMNKLEINITTHFHSGCKNTEGLVINIMKETYNNNCGGTNGMYEWAYLTQLSKPCQIIKNYPSIQRSWRGRR